MVKNKNHFRNHLKQNEDGRRWQCEFCGHQFGFGVQTKVFISHLAGVGASCAKVCENVPINIRNEAVHALQGIGEGPRKRTRIVLCSSYEVQKEDIEAEGSRVECNWEPKEPDAHETEEVEGGRSFAAHDSLHNFHKDMERSLMEDEGEHVVRDEQIVDAHVLRAEGNCEGQRGFPPRYSRQHMMNNMLNAQGTEEVALTTMDIGFSYHLSIDLALHECFLYCVLFPKHYKIEREMVIGYLIAEGIIDEGASRQEEFERGQVMLDRLENRCLLEACKGSLCVKMQKQLRSKAIQELKNRSTTLVKAGSELKELPPAKKWGEKLVRVSLMKNDIVEISAFDPPIRCPNLSTLLFGGNTKLKKIVSSFFEQFETLKVLDVSGCTKLKKLPKSISNLVNLVALFLCGCGKLTHVPSLAKLRELKILDLSNCSKLEDLPKGVELLSNLRYLDLSLTIIKEIPMGILLKLSRLQVLKLVNKEYFLHPQKIVEGKQVGRLRRLETLECAFRSPSSDFNEYIKVRDQYSQQSPSKYYFLIGASEGKDFWGPFSWKLSKEVAIIGCSIGKGQESLSLPNDIQALSIKGCNILDTWLCEECDGIESLSSVFCFSHDALKNLQHLQLMGLKNLRDLIRTEESTSSSTAPTLFPSNPSFSNLKSFKIWRCDIVKKLFPPNLFIYLQNLEEITVESCKMIEEIFATDEEEGGSNTCNGPTSPVTNIQLHLPKLRKLLFWELPGLKSICNGTLVCHSMEEIKLADCLKLKRIPFFLPLPSLQRIIASPKEWWESVEWGNPNAKNNLQYLCSS